MNFLDTNLYERNGEAISNFEYLLPDSEKDLGNDISKDHYNFDFLAISEP